MNRAAVIVIACAACGGEGEVCSIPGTGPGVDPSGEMCKQLSSYRLFDDIATQTPAEGVIPYALTTPLFSDYATKDRFVFVPSGEAMTWSDTGAFRMPMGTIVVKTFSYLADRRVPDGDRALLETRLLIRDADGWTGASYVYADGDATDAALAVAGATIDAAWIHDDGIDRANAYVVPNKNQCKLCHAEHDEVVDLLGPKARHVNRPGAAGSGVADQLQHFIDAGVLVGAPPPAMWPRAPNALDPQAGSLDARARAWLDINCAFCHNDRGAARTSGMFLDLGQTDPAALGVCKPPVAAGRGSGGRLYGIVPGQPDASIMMFRLESVEPDIKMPELGRNLVDAEGAALIRAWITQLPGACP